MMRNHTSLILMLAATLAFGTAIGWYLSPSVSGDQSAGVTDAQPLYWVAPMDAEYRRAEPGLSPMGMELVPVYAAEDRPTSTGGSVSISPIVQANFGIRTSAVAYGPLQLLVKTVGYVRYDEDRLQHIHTRVEGWIERLGVRASGDPVTAGQVLFEFYSPTLVNAQEELIAALGSGSQNLIGASRGRLEALGMSVEQIGRLERDRRVSQRTIVRAAVTGVVSELRVREGEYLTPATDTMTIASLDEVWIVGEVFERQSAWVGVGQTVDVRFDAYPGETWTGMVDYIYPELHQATRTLQVRIRIQNQDGRLRPNSYARVTIHGTETAPSIHVPLEAVIRGGRGDRVVLATGDGRFQSTRVIAGIEVGGRVQILSGLSAGDEIVVSGQFLIDSESSLTGEARRAGVDPDGSVDEGAGHDMGSSGADPADADADADTTDHSGHSGDGGPTP